MNKTTTIRPPLSAPPFVGGRADGSPCRTLLSRSGSKERAASTASTHLAPYGQTARSRPLPARDRYPQSAVGPGLRRVEAGA